MISGRTTGLSSPVSNVPPTSSRPSSTWVATGATIPGRCTGVGSVTSRCPLTRSHGTARSSPSKVGGSPVAKTTAPGWIGPAVVSTVTTRSPRTVTLVAATPVDTAGTVADSRATERSGLTRP